MARQVGSAAAAAFPARRSLPAAQVYRSWPGSCAEAIVVTISSLLRSYRSAIGLPRLLNALVHRSLRDVRRLRRGEEATPPGNRPAYRFCRLSTGEIENFSNRIFVVDKIWKCIPHELFHHDGSSLPAAPPRRLCSPSLLSEHSEAGAQREASFH